MENKRILAPMQGLVAPVAGGAEQPTRVVLMVSPCRSGSTAMMRVFGYAGFQAVYQPIKNALRWRHLGQARPAALPRGPAPVFLKETFGPYHHFEVTYNPLEALLQAGVAPGRIAPVILLRDPAEVWASWRAVWPEAARTALLDGAYRACMNVAQSAAEHGRRAHVLDFHAASADPLGALGALFARLGHTLPEAALTGWGDRPGLLEPCSGLHFPPEPDRYHMPQAHGALVASAGFGAGPASRAPTASERAEVAATGAGAVYRRLSALAVKRAG